MRAAVDTAQGFDVIMSAEQERDMQLTVDRRFSAVIHALSVDAQAANATHESDKTMIFERIRNRPGGFDDFNSMISGRLVNWLVGMFRKKLNGQWGDNNVTQESVLTGLPEQLERIGMLLMLFSLCALQLASLLVSLGGLIFGAIFTFFGGVLTISSKILFWMHGQTYAKTLRKADFCQQTRALLGKFCLILWPFSTALGPWVVVATGCTPNMPQHSCQTYATIAFLSGFLVMPSIIYLVVSIHAPWHAKNRATSMLTILELAEASKVDNESEEVECLLNDLYELGKEHRMVDTCVIACRQMAARLASKGSGALEASKLLISDLLEMGRKHKKDMSVHCIYVHIEIAALLSRNGQDASDHESAVCTLMSTRSELNKLKELLPSELGRSNNDRDQLGRLKNGLVTAAEFEAYTMARLNLALQKHEEALVHVRRACEAGISYPIDELKPLQALKNHKPVEWHELAQLQARGLLNKSEPDSSCFLSDCLLQLIRILMLALTFAFLVILLLLIGVEGVEAARPSAAECCEEPQICLNNPLVEDTSPLGIDWFRKFGQDLLGMSYADNYNKTLCNITQAGL